MWALLRTACTHSILNIGRLREPDIEGNFLLGTYTETPFLLTQ